MNTDEVLRRARLPRLSVVCSGRRSHGRVTLAQFDLDEGALREVLSRDGAFRGGTTEGGATVSNRAVVPAESLREDHEGRRRWRFTCPRCSRDVPMTAERLTQALAALNAAGEDALDISALPRP